jgi:hypothetical protein
MLSGKRHEAQERALIARLAMNGLRRRIQRYVEEERSSVTKQAVFYRAMQ